MIFVVETGFSRAEGCALGYAIVILIAFALVYGVWRLLVLRRVASDPGRRRRWTTAIVGYIALSSVLIAVVAS